MAFAGDNVTCVGWFSNGTAIDVSYVLSAFLVAQFRHLFEKEKPADSKTVILEPAGFPMR
jgi:hypothetical protein